jgi:hypothetical protein
MIFSTTNSEACPTRAAAGAGSSTRCRTHACIARRQAQVVAAEPGHADQCLARRGELGVVERLAARVHARLHAAD